MGGVNFNTGNVLTAALGTDLGIGRKAAESRRTDANKPDDTPNSETANRNASAATARQQFVLGTSDYRRVLATLESERGAATSDRVQRDGDGSFTGQRAQRAYQDAADDGERESVARLFGVDVFA